jgi:peroxiredoxin
MSSVQAGQDAPEFALTRVSGEQFSLTETLKRGPVVAAFFKISCPVCQFTLPFIERLFQAYGGDRVAFVGISQDDADATWEFCREYGLTFPALIDPEGYPGYPASNDYGITNVPTYYLISPQGKVEIASVGLTKHELEQISEWLARFLGRTPTPVFLPDEIVPESKSGCRSKN